MSALADNDGVRPAAEPLGSLLVKRGLITQEQLAVALEAQKGSGEPLGAIVVAHGFASPATIAQALATQFGGLLKTEYGFATGFGASTQRPVPIGEPPISTARIGVRPSEASPVAVAPAPAPPPAETVTAVVETPVHDPEVEQAADREAVRAELAAASVETERLTAANARLAEARAELEQRLAHETQRAASLETELGTLRAEAAESGGAHELEQRLAEAEARHAAELAARETTIEEFRAAVQAWQTAHAELEQRLAAEAEPAGDDGAELEELRAAARELQAGKDELEQRLVRESERAASLEAERASVDELRAAASAAEAARVELEERIAQELAAAALRDETIAELQGALDEAISAKPEQAPAEAEPWASAERHLLFFQAGSEYELVERAGPPPAPGTDVQVAGVLSAQVVTRVGKAPVPASVLPCAYLMAAGLPSDG